MWTREFGRDPAVIGRQLTLDGESVRIVGIMPPVSRFPEHVDGWVSFRRSGSVRSKEMWHRERWLFAGVGLLLAAVGIYGVLAQITRGRAREMGIRIALGARPVDVQWLVLRHGAGIMALGAAIGIVVALGTTRVLASLLFDLSPNDPASYVWVVAILAATSAAASFTPAWRASRADPADALRAD